MAGQDDTVRPPLRAMAGKYLLLYRYLEDRYADTVVLTFAQIEDLLGFPLPERANLDREWWTAAARASPPSHADSWILASRTALPNLVARTVLFQRTA